jgi:RNA polymerase sigma-70 factor (ECF subfamily)
MAPGPQDVTSMLVAWSGGDSSMEEPLMEALYDDLRRKAAGILRHGSPGRTLQPTALVNEAYLRLVDQKRVRWQNRAHFLAVAARLMRRVLIDYARRQRAAKRGGAATRVTLEDFAAPHGASPLDLLALDEALADLAALDARQARIVELRAFGGLGVEETAEVLGVSPATVKRDWSFAQAWLERRLRRARRAGGDR